jgi:hypothetical protein
MPVKILYFLTYLSYLRFKSHIFSILEEANPSPNPIYYYPERPVSRLPKPNAETGTTKVPERELLGKSTPHPAVKPLGKHTNRLPLLDNSWLSFSIHKAKHLS